MGALCSSVDKDGDEPSEGKAQGQVQLQSHIPRRLHKMPQPGMAMRPKTWRPSTNSAQIMTEAEYFKARDALIKAEKSTAFDAEVIANASEIEKKASDIVRGIRNHDWDTIYHMPPSHKRRCPDTDNIIVEKTAGEHFLGNVDLINQTRLFQVARKMPKGAHLHVHFNSCLPPKFLIKQARTVPDTMYIASSHTLRKSADYRNCRIQFMVWSAEGARNANSKLDADAKIPVDQPSETNIFNEHYAPMRWMNYQLFIQLFDWTDDTNNIHYRGIEKVEDWLEEKMQFNVEEVHGISQTTRG